jgi:glycosyltransferase involved in cell wall biosynthesis
VEASVPPPNAGFALRVVREERAGLSHARNRALEEARGRYICWTDDDVTFEREWLAAYATAFHRHPNAGFFGGAIIPHLEPPAVPWVRRCAGDWPLQAAFAARTPPREERIAPTQLPWGANFAFVAKAAEGIRFNPELGHGPSGRLGEESEFLATMLDRGVEGWWVPDSRVRHRIGPDRQSRPYLEDYFRRAGETLAFLETVRPEERPRPLGWSAARAPSGLLRTLRPVFLPMEWLIWMPRLDRFAVRAIARRNLYQGILESRRRSDVKVRGPGPLAGAVP